MSVWRGYAANVTYVEAILMLKTQDASTRPASLATSATMAGVPFSADGVSSSPAMLSDKKDWTMGNLEEAEKRERVRVKRCFRKLYKSCCVKMRKVP